VTEDQGFSLIIGYGSDMGTAEYVAMQLADELRDEGIVDVAEAELNTVELSALASTSHFIVVTSTFGDGEFPDNATVFWEALADDGAERLEHLDFAVLALGDTSYPMFCQAGKDLDARLQALGSTRIADRIDCDCCYEKDAEAWRADMVKLLREAAAAGGQTAVAEPAPAVARPSTERSPWDREHPFDARLVVNRMLTAPESDKEVRHFEIYLGDSGITYRAGDSIAVQPVNDPDLVAAVLDRLGADPADTVADCDNNGDRPLGELLAHHLEIRTPSRALQALVAARTGDREAAAVLDGADPEALNRWLYGRDVLDLLELTEPSALDLQEVVETLRPLQFRDYSIASSPLVHPDCVHLTVAAVRHSSGGRARGGVASTFMADRTDSVRVHLRPNHNFRLPAADVPIIMIGPGTGIAPFRAFLQERQAAGAAGRSWLFFGDRRRTTDFLYGTELQGFVDSQVLTRLDLAFSRDATDNGRPKDYVQHHMAAVADELYGWLQDGAYIYVCGDAERMARDVDATLHRIIAEAGRMDAEAAHAYVNELIKSHRYVRDVY
jgi:sulfite reductase (NADPH) flavoprotein alpha-component